MIDPAENTPAPTDHDDWVIGRGGPVQTAILFVDLVSSSEFASVLPLEEYFKYVESFHEMCEKQLNFFFRRLHGERYKHDGRHYSYKLVGGDELVVFLHTNHAASDVYQLICLAIALKCAWLSAPLNRRRLESGHPFAEIAVGIHAGKVWARRDEDGFRIRGFNINVAKRCETASRGGDTYRIFVTMPAVRLIHRKVRNIVFAPRQLVPLKGVLNPIWVHEIMEGFVNVGTRLEPELLVGFEEMAGRAIHSGSFDLWLHSCYQIHEEFKNKRVTDDRLTECLNVLGIAPDNPVALYLAAQGMREHDDLDSALNYLEDLTRFHPMVGDGWLELGRVQKKLGMSEAAARSIIQARRHGVKEEEEALS